MIARGEDIRALRKRMQLSQSQFASRFGFSIGTLREWEQGRRAPQRSTLTLLSIISVAPDVVTEAISRLDA